MIQSANVRIICHTMFRNDVQDTSSILRPVDRRVHRFITDKRKDARVI